MMERIPVYMDFETKSNLNIKEVGSMRYLQDPVADILMMGYKINGGPTKMWFPGHPPVDFMVHPERYLIYAHNIQFDRRVWNLHGVKKYGYSRLELDNCMDVMALCGRYGIYQSLDGAGRVMKLKIGKDRQGKLLLKKITQPPFRYTDTEWRAFIDYCRTDVDSMHELIHSLPATRLSDKEQAIWKLTAEINDKGMPIDSDAVDQILRVTSTFQASHAERLPAMTGGLVTKITQTARIVRWVQAQGVPMPNLQAGTVHNYIQDPVTPDHVRELLVMRQDLGKSSIAKYKKIQDQVYKGRIYDNLRFYGTHTGRWSGMGFQPHNLPRYTVEDQDATVEQFFDLSIIQENPIKAAQGLIRGMIKARPGFKIVAADYASIENRIISWVNEDWETLDKFANDPNYDQYKEMAAFLYKVPFEEVTKAQRLVGKIAILGCGYQLGWRGLIKTADSWGVTLVPDQSLLVVNSYRDKYFKIKQGWYGFKNAAIRAINNPGYQFKFRTVQFRVVTDKVGTSWLAMVLPSGRVMFYNSPEVRPGDYGPEITAVGINPYSKKWMRMRITPGRLTENIVQALARDVLAEGKLNLAKTGHNIISSIHDEVVLEEEEGLIDFDYIIQLMIAMPEWADGLPLAAEGFIDDRFHK